MRICAMEGKAIAEEMPAHQATIKLGLDQVEERWNGLNGLVAAAKEKSAAAELYFKLLGECDNFLREANRSLLGWSRKVSMLDNKKGGNCGIQDIYLSYSLIIYFHDILHIVAQRTECRKKVFPSCANFAQKGFPQVA